VTHDLVVRGAAEDVAVSDGVITDVGQGLGPGRVEIDARGSMVLPGGVDIHVHLDDPGRADWEGFDTGTRALAAGGVTCAADMPLNALPPTLDAASFDAKVAAAQGTARIDFALWGGLVPGGLAGMDELAERGVVGFKAFMCPSGVDEFPAADPDTLARGMERAAALGLPVAVHAEDPGLVTRLGDRARAEGRRSMRDWAASRPVEAELAAIGQALGLAEQTGCSLHVVHVSSAGGADLVARARARGVDATCETCPHYLTLDEDDAARIGALAKCAPPLRSSAEQRALWERVRGGAVDLVASDHSPGPPGMKQGDDMFAVWGGISGAQSTLPLMLTHGPGHGVSPGRMADLLSAAPAARLRLAEKGRIAPGADADLAIVRVGSAWEPRAGDWEYRHRHSPFTGHRLTARVVRTLLRGVTVWGEGADPGAPARGRLVRPSAAVAR
jgi:allantoinase